MLQPSAAGRAARAVLVIASAVATVAITSDVINGFPHGLTYDDAYFYAGIAWHLGTSGHSTFDGVNTTSGYHLLWGWILGGLSALLAPLTTDRLAHLFLFEAAFVALAFALAAAYFRGVLERFCIVVFAVMGTLLMETLLLSGLLLVLAHGERRRPYGGDVGAAPLLATLLVPLARIDAALIVGIHAALLALQGERRAGLGIGAAATAGVLVQIGLMLAYFGEPFSVSSIIKASNAAPFGGTIRASIFGPDGVALGYVVRFALFAGLVLVAGAAGLAGSRSPIDRRLLSLAAGAAAFTGGHVVSQMMPFWCYLPAYVVLFYAVVRVEPVSPLLVTAQRAVVIGTAVLGVAFLAHKVLLYTSQISIVQGARAFVAAVPRHVPADQRIYQIDGAGFTGFFSGRSIVNGDGLVNTYRYARRARAGELDGYLDEQGICYLITNTGAAEDLLVDFGGLRVTRDQVTEVWRSAAHGAFTTTDFVLYRRMTPRCEPAEL